jgi:rare lipoprotein A
LLSTDFRNFGRLFAVVLTAAALGACAQSNVNRTEFRTASRPPSLQNNRTALRVTHRRVAVALRKHTPFATDKHAPETQFASTGVASFYSDEQETANGETFDPNKLTAAHPTLPFGTRLRVTNVSTGRSVTVRVNDRGPFVPGRIVDVSYSAAQSLGIVDRGIAKVKLDVVQ